MYMPTLEGAVPPPERYFAQFIDDRFRIRRLYPETGLAEFKIAALDRMELEPSRPSASA